MAINNLSEELLGYFARLPEQDQMEVISFVKTYVDGGGEDEQSQTLEEYNRELEDADAEIGAGNYIDHKEVIQHFLNRRK